MELRVRGGAGRAGHPPGHHPGHRADRDDHRGVPDGGDPVPAAQPRRGPQRRPLGLHLLHHQELPGPRGRVRPPGPLGGDHDPADDAGLHGAAGPGLPPARRLGDRRHVRRDPGPPERGGQRRRAGEGARGQGPRGRRRLRRLVGGAPGPRAGRPGGVRRRARRGPEPDPHPPPRGRGAGRGRPARRRRDHGLGDRGRRADEHRGRDPLHRVLAAGERRRRDPRAR